MVDRLAWLKFLLDILKNWRVIAPIFALLVSYSGWSTYDNSVKAEELKYTQTQVREIAEYYSKPKCDCAKLEQRINKLERWHR